MLEIFSENQKKINNKTFPRSREWMVVNRRRMRANGNSFKELFVVFVWILSVIFIPVSQSLWSSACESRNEFTQHFPFERKRWRSRRSSRIRHSPE